MSDRAWSPTEERVLEAALRVISRRGIRRLSMGEVGEVAQVSRTTLYRYFGTKERLVAGVAAYELQRFSEGLEKVVVGLAEGAQQAKAALGYMVRYNEQHPMRELADTEPGFVLQYLAAHMPAVRDLLWPHLVDVLELAPAVQAGQMTAEEVLDVIVRLHATSWVLPTEKRSHLLAAMDWLVEGERSPQSMSDKSHERSYL